METCQVRKFNNVLKVPDGDEYDGDGGDDHVCDVNENDNDDYVNVDYDSHHHHNL